MKHAIRCVVTGHDASGRAVVVMDGITPNVKAGEVVVQQGTNHARVNRGSRTCRVAFVLIDANGPPSRKND